MLDPFNHLGCIIFKMHYPILYVLLFCQVRAFDDTSATFVDVLSWEKLDVLLESFPTFIDMESPMSNMSELFSAMQ